MEKNARTLLWLGLGAGAAAAAGAALMRRPSQARRRRAALHAIGRAADELSGIMKIF